MKSEQTQSDSKIRIRRAGVDSICVYEVTEYELDILEKGSPSSLYLNFSITLITMGISFLITLLTTEIMSDRIYSTFVIIVVISLALGFILLILWYKTYRSSTSVAKKIKDRLKEDIAPKIEEYDSVKPNI